MEVKHFKTIKEFIGITIGVALTALGLDLFLIPLKIAAGGVSGLATILHYIFGSPVGLTMLAIDIPLFLLSIRQMGMAFGLKSLYGTVLLSVLIDVLAGYVSAPTHDALLSCIYGGVVVGLGIGITFRFKGTTGGTDLAASMVSKWTGIPVGQCLMFFDGTVILAAGLIFGAEPALLALITVFITAKVIDVVQEGWSNTKAALIISQKHEDISQEIMAQMERGATALLGKGLYTGTKREIVLSVVAQREVSQLKELVYQIDPNAFVILADVHEVLGEGFKRIR